MINSKYILSPTDIYKMHNKRKRTYKKIWQIITDIYSDQVNNIQTETLYLKKLRIKYNIDERTLKRYLKGYIFKIWRNSILILNDLDLHVINETIMTVNKYLELKEKNQRLAKYIVYNKITWQTPK